MLRYIEREREESEDLYREVTNKCRACGRTLSGGEAEYQTCEDPEDCDPVARKALAFS